jgi:hypothetical protein
MKTIYLDLIEKYPELTSHKNVKYTSFKFKVVDYGNIPGGGMIGGSCQPNFGYYQRSGNAHIEIGVNQFGSGSKPTNLTKNTFFHELIHCTSGLLNDIDDYIETGSEFLDKYPYLEESSVWPVAGNYAPFGEDIEAMNFYRKLTDIFIKRGDKGDRWRILLAVRMDGAEAFNKRLSFLTVPSGYASPLMYLESLFEDKNDESRTLFKEASSWISSKTPSPADYATYSFGEKSFSAPVAQDSMASIQEPTVKPENCPDKAPEPGPLAGKDIIPEVKINQVSEWLLNGADYLFTPVIYMISEESTI